MEIKHDKWRNFSRYTESVMVHKPPGTPSKNGMAWSSLKGVFYPQKSTPPPFFTTKEKTVFSLYN